MSSISSQIPQTVYVWYLIKNRKKLRNNSFAKKFLDRLSPSFLIKNRKNFQKEISVSRDKLNCRLIASKLTLYSIHLLLFPRKRVKSPHFP